MGIGGLLMNTKSIGKRRNLSHFRGKRAGVDGYSWLHKALICCATEVAINKNLYKIVRYFEKNIRTMLSLQIKVLIVFDGDKLPLKDLTESNRHESRQKNFDLALHSFHSGRHEEANRLFSQAIDITPSMAYFVKLRLDEIFPNQLEFIVAPYEADSQLAYLSKTNYIDFVITEDSDLMVFGAKRMFYKMDKDFWGVEVELGRLPECEEYSFKGWTHDKFIQFCILAGCDYLSSPKGIKFKKAYAILAKYGSVDKVLKALADRLDEGYYYRFLCAYIAFKYQRVFCPFKKQIVCLNDFKIEEIKISNSFDHHAALKSIEFFGSLDFIGRTMDTRIAIDLAGCRIDPITKKSFKEVGQIEFVFDKKNRQSFKSLKKQLECEPLVNVQPSDIEDKIEPIPLEKTKFFMVKKPPIRIFEQQSSFVPFLTLSEKKTSSMQNAIQLAKNRDFEIEIEDPSPEDQYASTQTGITSDDEQARIGNLVKAFILANQRIQHGLGINLSQIRSRLHSVKQKS